MSKNIGRKIVRVLLWVFGIIFALVLLIFVALMLPPVQQHLTGQLESMLEDRLDTDLGIGSIGLKFPKALAIRDVYVNTPAGDSLFRLGELAVDINMLRLFKRQVVIQQVLIRDVYGRVVITDSTSNIDFLINNLLPTDTAAVVGTDPAPSANEAPTWDILLPYSELTVDGADVYYQDDLMGILLDTEIGYFHAKTDSLNLATGDYSLQNLELTDSQIRLRLGESQIPPDTTAAPPLNVSCDKLVINNSGFSMSMDSMDLSTYLRSAKVVDLDMDVVDEKIRLVTPSLQIQDGAFSMDIPAPPIERGLDYNHLGLSGIQADLVNLQYSLDTIAGTVRHLAARDKSGFQLNEVQTSVFYTPYFLGLKDIVLRTESSRISGPLLQVDYHFTGNQPLDSLAIDADLNVNLAISDLLYLAPQLREIALLRNNSRRQFIVNTRLQGNGRVLAIDRLYVDGPGIRARATGRVQQPFDPKRLSGQLRLDELRAQPRDLVSLLPAGTVPAGIDWPNWVDAEGVFNYRGDVLDLRLNAVEGRAGTELSSRVSVYGQVAGVQAYPNTRFDITIDTLLATRQTILAYMPPNSLPAGYEIPAYAQGSGSIEGTPNNLNVDISLAVAGAGTRLHAQGNIANLLQPDSLRLDLRLSDLALAAADVNRLLPDSLLPEFLNLPDISINSARLQGPLNNLQFEVPLQTSNGNWQVSGRYNPRNLDLQVAMNQVNLPLLFNQPWRDSIATIGLGKIDLTAQVRGQLEPDLSLDFDGHIREQGNGQILAFDGQARGETYQGDFTITHPALRAQGNGLFAQADSVQRVEAFLDISYADLERWDLSEGPLYLDGKLTARVNGLSLDNMSANLRLDEVQLRTDTSSAYVDSLVATAELHNGTNEIFVNSDLLELSVTGEFQPDKVFTEMTRFIQGYYDESIIQPDPVVYGNRMDVELFVKNPRPLTMGLIPGLREISTLQMDLLYRDQRPEFLLNLNVPRLNYSGVEMDSLVMIVQGDTATLSYQADWQNIDVNDQIILGRTSLSGNTENNNLGVELTVWNEGDTARHQLAFALDPEADTLQLTLRPQQIINYENWTVPPGNLLRLTNDQLVIRDLSLESGSSRLAIETTEPNDVVVEFSEFNLDVISRLIRSEEELIAGRVNGRVEADNVLSQMAFRADLTIDETRVMASPLGRVAAKVDSDNNQTFNVDVRLTEQGNDVSLTGVYRQSGQIDLTLDAQRLPLTSIEPFSAGMLENSAGYLTGRVNVTGNFNEPRYDGSLRFVDATVGIGMLSTTFQLGEQAIAFNGQSISIDGLTLTDPNGNSATLRGGVRARSVSDYTFDLHLRARDFLVIDSEEGENDLYYGYLTIDADVDITGNISEPDIFVTATPGEDSRITYLLPSSNLPREETGAGVRVFVDRPDWDRYLSGELERLEDQAAAQGFNLTLNLSITPDLTATVVLNPITGDQFTGQAEGDISFKQYADGRMEMTGRVEVVSGTYVFTYQGVISREFSVVPGSNIMWTGNVMNPRLDLTVAYRVKTSPFGLVSEYGGTTGELTSDLRQQRTFEVRVYMTGELEETNIRTDIAYPEDAFGNTNSQPIINSLTYLRTDQSQLNTQAFSLLLFRNFASAEAAAANQGGGLEGTVQSGLDNILTSQLNNLANNYLSFVELDFGVESYNDLQGNTQRNVRLSVRKRLLNDRLILSIDGVTSTDDAPAGGAQTYLDNLTAEYLLTPTGSLRIKIFSDRDLYNFAAGNVVRLGGRLVFSKDFDTIRWFGSGKNK